MNCKPGDLARIIDCPGTRMSGVVDRFIHVTTCFVGSRGTVLWNYEGPMYRCLCGCGGMIRAFADEVLRPIRDPGDDAKDEMLRPLPADAGIQHLRETVRAFKAMREAGVCP